jgi:hypothetical protein
MRGIAISFLLVCALTVASELNAQVPPPPTTSPPPTPTQVPIDGGALLLAAAGSVYGVKKLYKRNKRSK